MREIRLLCVGKLKETYWREASAEYEKRLRAYCDLRVIEVADERAPETLSASGMEAVKDKEAERLLKYDDKDAYMIAFTIDGTRYDSVSFAERMRAIQETGDGRLIFAIGGSLGLGDAVLRRANERISFSDMTFPHQLARVVALEQIYRGYRIRNGEPYHK